MQMINGFFEPDDGGWKERSRVAYWDTKKANNRCSNFSYSVRIINDVFVHETQNHFAKVCERSFHWSFLNTMQQQVQRHNDDRRRNMKAALWKAGKVSETPQSWFSKRTLSNFIQFILKGFRFRTRLKTLQNVPAKSKRNQSFSGKVLGNYGNLTSSST